ncbi:HNH endonuclease signature motif containing protein [Megasphaera elsdenii]|uniref:HNH endonuclease signature motif containing protein n=1 Tax=Megasphaera elsdenii TaxID=907 RepID=UPI003520B73D
MKGGEGMANGSPFHSFYWSTAWLSFSAMIRQQRFHVCELCGAPNSSEVHHLVHINKDNINDPATTLNADNVMLLCRSCHHAVHERGKYKARRTTFDASGNIVGVKEPSSSSLTPLQESKLNEATKRAKCSVKNLHQFPPG